MREAKRDACVRFEMRGSRAMAISRRAVLSPNGSSLATMARNSPRGSLLDEMKVKGARHRCCARGSVSAPAARPTRPARQHQQHRRRCPAQRPLVGGTTSEPWFVFVSRGSSAIAIQLPGCPLISPASAFSQHDAPSAAAASETSRAAGQLATAAPSASHDLHIGVCFCGFLSRASCCRQSRASAFFWCKPPAPRRRPRQRA